MLLLGRYIKYRHRAFWAVLPILTILSLAPLPVTLIEPVSLSMSLIVIPTSSESLMPVSSNTKIMARLQLAKNSVRCYNFGFWLRNLYLNHRALVKKALTHCPTEEAR